MAFFKKIFGREGSKDPKLGSGDALERADRLLSNGCYCGALWWSAKALEAASSSASAADVLERPLPNVIAISTRAAPQAKWEAIKSRLALAE